jgi:DNA-binding HxlR family transcriptional regulator
MIPAFVQKHVQIRMVRSHSRCEVPNRPGIINVENIADHPRVSRRDLFKQRLPASSDDNLVAGCMELVRELAADTRRAACDQNGVAGHFHDGSFACGRCDRSDIEVTNLEEVGTLKFYTHQKESDHMTAGQAIRRSATTVGRRPIQPPPKEIDPRVEALVTDLIGRVADKWTMLILEVLLEQGTVRFTRLGKLVGGISQKMLTQTLRQMERDGLISRTVYPVVPPKVEYQLTELGSTLSEAFCGVWIWADQNLTKVEAERRAFDKRASER